MNAIEIPVRQVDEDLGSWLVRAKQPLYLAAAQAMSQELEAIAKTRNWSALFTVTAVEHPVTHSATGYYLAYLCLADGSKIEIALAPQYWHEEVVWMSYDRQRCSDPYDYREMSKRVEHFLIRALSNE